MPVCIMKTLPVLDVFSGIGGFSLALKGVGHTVAYCECLPSARAVLMHNMSVGRLDEAPIYHDVQTMRMPLKGLIEQPVNVDCRIPMSRREWCGTIF